MDNKCEHAAELTKETLCMHIDDAFAPCTKERCPLNKQNKETERVSEQGTFSFIIFLIFTY